MENTPEAAGVAQAPQTEQTPTTNPEPAQAPQMPDMHGFTSEQLADIDKFFKANGGFDAIKSKISNPAPSQQVSAEQQPQAQQQYQQPQPQPQPVKIPDGAITPQEFIAQQYFMSLANEEKYSGISDSIASGDILKEMASFNIHPVTSQGYIDDGMVRKFLDLKAQTVPAKTTGTTPDASSAPTVTYVEVGDNITDINQAYQVLSQDAQLKRQGLTGHPSVAKAEAFIKENLGKTK